MHLACADQGGRALELLGGKQAKRVAGDDGGSRASVPAGEPAVEDGERRKREVGLCLPAARREPDQVNKATIRRVVERRRLLW